MSKILLADESANFSIDDEREKPRMKEATTGLASLISSMNLGSEEMPIKEHVQLAREDIVDAKYCMGKLVDLAWVEKSIWV